MYLLDTCVVSDFVKGDPLTLSKIKAQKPSSLFVSSVSYMEIMYGLEKNSQKVKKIQPIIHAFLKTISTIDFTIEAAKAAAEIRYDLSKKGTLIGPFDLLIASIAVSQKLTLITSNLSEFKRVSDLVCENWRSP